MSRGAVLYNGVVEPMRPGAAVCDSLVFRNGVIVAVGANLQRDPEYARLPQVDLRGAAVYPGFVDAHTHLYYFSQTLGRANLDNTRSLIDALHRVREHARKLKRDAWVVGAGIDVRGWQDQRWPSATDLDKVTGGRPALIFSKDYHSAWVNSRALEISGISRRTPEPAGGAIERLADGAPSGMLREKSAYLPVFEKIRPADERTRQKLFHNALEIAYQRGVTGAHSFDGWDGYQFMRSLAERRRLGLRVRYNVLAEDLMRAVSELGERKLFGYGDDWLKITGVKVFADGALGSQTALMYRPFTGSEGNCGIAVTSPAELMKITRRAKRHGLPLAVHAIGDRAVTEVVTTLADNPPPAGTRHRVEHLQITRKKDLSLVAKSRVVCSMQPSHLPSDIPIMQRYLGLRINNCYLFGSLLKRGVPLAFGSDVPIEPLNPLGGIVDAVRRVSHSGGAAVNPTERISALAAARAFSHGAAFAVAEEHAFGSLLPGYRADLTILSHDLRRVNLRSVGDVSVVATVIDGKCVYSAGALAF